MVLAVIYNNEEITPSYSQAVRMRRISEQGILSAGHIREIMEEPKANQREYLRLSEERYGPYCRLSKDDEKQGDSESIKTQKAMLSQFAAERGFIVVGIYVDDGWSGLYFDRPDFQRMINDVEAGKIDIVITKNLSRLGRDHLQVRCSREKDVWLLLSLL